MRPNRVHRSVCHRLHRGRVGNVADMDQRLAAARLDLMRDRLGLGVIAARIDHDRGAAIRQRQRNRAPDIAPGAGDDRNFAGEFLVSCIAPRVVIVREGGRSSKHRRPRLTDNSVITGCPAFAEHDSDGYARNVPRSIFPSYNPAISRSASSLCDLLQPPC